MFNIIAGSYNGPGEYNGDGWDGGRSFGGRGRGRSFWGRGRGYGGQSGGYYDYGESEAPPAQGRGKLVEQSILSFTFHIFTLFLFSGDPDKAVLFA